ncbi:MAG TPA: outer membrane lipoprotein carrier protein LolA [Ignavibacteriaceae bacterium]|nr:outer membrane lipoprotein carrier protein LolA [Ignavibacteriaceae bacterium]
MKSLIFLIALTFICSYAFAQDTTDELLKSVQSKYDAQNSISVNFNKSGGTKEDFSGKLYLKKENKLRIELKNNVIVTDGQTFWNYDRKQKKVIINNYDASDPSEFSLHSFINVYPSKCDVSSGEEGDLKTLTLVPKTSELNFKTAKLYINDNNLVEKVMIENNNGKSIITLSGYKLNRNLPDSDFTFSPPEGIKVIDLR